MKNDTKEKLKSIALSIWKIHGIEAVNFSDLPQIAFREAKKMDLSIHWLTIKKWQPELENMIKNLNIENYIIDDEFIDNMPKNKEDSCPAPEYIDLQFGGKIWKYKKIDEVVETPQITEVKKPIQTFTGLFDYNDSKNIIIRRGKYTGTNIGKKSSILQKFGSMSWFYKWCHGQIVRGQKVNFPDTKRDMETLAKIIKFIDDGMTFGK